MSQNGVAFLAHVYVHTYIHGSGNLEVKLELGAPVHFTGVKPLHYSVIEGDRKAGVLLSRACLAFTRDRKNASPALVSRNKKKDTSHVVRMYAFAHLIVRARLRRKTQNHSSQDTEIRQQQSNVRRITDRDL